MRTKLSFENLTEICPAQHLVKYKCIFLVGTIWFDYNPRLGMLTQILKTIYSPADLTGIRKNLTGLIRIFKIFIKLWKKWYKIVKIHKSNAKSLRLTKITKNPQNWQSGSKIVEIGENDIKSSKLTKRTLNYNEYKICKINTKLPQLANWDKNIKICKNGTNRKNWQNRHKIVKIGQNDIKFSKLAKMTQHC